MVIVLQVDGQTALLVGEALADIVLILNIPHLTLYPPTLIIVMEVLKEKLVGLHSNQIYYILHLKFVL